MTKKPEISKPVHPPYALFGDVFVFPKQKDLVAWERAHHPDKRTGEEDTLPERVAYDEDIHKGHLHCTCSPQALLIFRTDHFTLKKGARHARTCDHADTAKPLTLSSGQHSILYNPRYPPNSLATRFNGPLICIGKGPPEPWLGILKKTPSNHSIYTDGKNLMNALHAIQQNGALQNTSLLNNRNAIRADKMGLDLTDKASDSPKNNLTDLFNALKDGDSYPVVIRAAVPPQQAQRESEYYGKQVLTFPTFTTDPVTTIQFLDREIVQNLRNQDCQEFYAVAYPVLSADKKSISLVVAAKQDICQIIPANTGPA